jgi:hypothetical protein
MVVEITCDCIFDALDFRNEQLILAFGIIR